MIGSFGPFAIFGSVNASPGCLYPIAVKQRASHDFTRASAQLSGLTAEISSSFRGLIRCSSPRFIARTEIHASERARQMQSSEDRSLIAARSSIHRLTVSEAATAGRDMLHPCQPSWARMVAAVEIYFCCGAVGKFMHGTTSRCSGRCVVWSRLPIRVRSFVRALGEELAQQTSFPLSGAWRSLRLSSARKRGKAFMPQSDAAKKCKRIFNRRRLCPRSLNHDCSWSLRDRSFQSRK